MSIFPYKGQQSKEQQTSEKQAKKARPATGEDHQKLPGRADAYRPLGGLVNK
jgi:hypothetical protein